MDVMEGMLEGAQEPAWLEKTVVGDIRAWQIIFLTIAGITAIIITLCCFVRFRIPRTKQQIEADYHRRKITKKFRQQLEKIQNSQMDSIDLKAALELIRADFKMDERNKSNISLISSIDSAAQSLEENSSKSMHLVNNNQHAEEMKPVQNNNFGSRLMALVRVSKQKESDKKNNIEC